ncbi:MAG: 2-amino-4-hydroxy-6-hydroxymethyldihydropteridine diphosphokinase [Candidatus Omnitrophica bacterium]|nr:2-amino-4-hydroxy-6-hydroxymethyldihydropteridine diphosphokinase [Candidatus Omnitrophota bacterium]
MAIVFIGLGSNLGDRSRNINQAVRLLRLESEIEVLAVSSLRETKPQAASGQDYLNAVAKLDTALEPEELLEVLQGIENHLGRKRPFKNAPRTMDIDILTYDQRTINSPRLTVPHPAMLERDFVLEPLLEIEPDFKNAYHC